MQELTGKIRFVPPVSSSFSVISDHPFLHSGRLRQSQSTVHHVGRGDLGRIVQMTVDVCRGTDIAVTELLLDLLHGNAVCQQQGSTAVSKVVEADVPQPVLLQDGREVIGDCLRRIQISHWINKDITLVFLVVTVSADLHVFLLLFS